MNALSDQASLMLQKGSGKLWDGIQNYWYKPVNDSGGGVPDRDESDRYVSGDGMDVSENDIPWLWHLVSEKVTALSIQGIDMSQRQLSSCWGIPTGTD